MTLFHHTVKNGVNEKKPIKKSLDAFLNKCKNIVNIRISHLENNFEINKSPKSYSIIKTKLQKLATRFGFVPADKAANNVVVVNTTYMY